MGGCGGKGSSGVQVSATITPTYNGVNTSSVDAVQNICTNASTGQTQPEYFADHTATVSIIANLINPSNVIKQMTVYIDSYTIDYQSSADSAGAPAIQSDARNKTTSFIVSSPTPSSVASITVELVDLIRKNKYSTDALTASSFLNNYTATYTFSGHSENGVPLTFSAQTDFQIGAFNNCPAGFF
jgi:hypothetical protein